MIRPIETYYNGYRFRSRLEARWAVFFDALKIPYRYELQGYDVDGMAYLPDFVLYSGKEYLEVKPYTPTRMDFSKISGICRDTESISYIVEGDPFYPRAYRFKYCQWDVKSPSEVVDYGNNNVRFDVVDVDESGYVMCNEVSKMCWWPSMGSWSPVPYLDRETRDIIRDVLSKTISDDLFDLLIRHVERAMLHARQCRFEHGERP